MRPRVSGVALATLLLAVACGRTQGSGPNSVVLTQALVHIPTDVDLGRVYLTSKTVDLRIDIKNTMESRVVARTAKASCACLTIRTPVVACEAGESEVLEVRLHPGHRAGRQDAYLRVKLEAGELRWEHRVAIHVEWLDDVSITPIYAMLGQDASPVSHETHVVSNRGRPIRLVDVIGLPDIVRPSVETLSPQELTIRWTFPADLLLECDTLRALLRLSVDGTNLHREVVFRFGDRSADEWVAPRRLHLGVLSDAEVSRCITVRRRSTTHNLEALVVEFEGVRGSVDSITRSGGLALIDLTILCPTPGVVLRGVVQIRDEEGAVLGRIPVYGVRL